MANNKPSIDYLATWVGDGATTPRSIVLQYQPRAGSITSDDNGDGILLVKNGIPGDLALSLPSGLIVPCLSFVPDGIEVSGEANALGVTYYGAFSA
jgi:hypothetical protein